MLSGKMLVIAVPDKTAFGQGIFFGCREKLGSSQDAYVRIYQVLPDLFWFQYPK